MPPCAPSGVKTSVSTVLGCSFQTCCGKRFQRVEKVAHDAAPPAQLLLEKNGQRVWYRGPAQRVIVDICPIAAQQRLVRQKPVFALVHWNAKPMPRANRWLNLQQQVAPDREQASTDAADAARPILGNLVELESRVVNRSA